MGENVNIAPRGFRISLGKGPILTCGHCLTTFSHKPVMVKGKKTYGIHDQDSSQFTHNPGENNECPRPLWELARKNRDKYGPDGKIFNVLNIFCSEKCKVEGA